MATKDLTNVDTNELGRIIGQSVAEGMVQSQPPRQMTYGEYQRKYYSGKPKLTRVCSQNGYPVENLSPEETRLFNRVVRPGRYMDRRVEVVIQDDGSDATVDLRYHNKDINQRFQLGSLLTMLTQIVTEQDVLLASEKTREASRASA